jgi:hypothetical protein
MSTPCPRLSTRPLLLGAVLSAACTDINIAGADRPALPGMPQEPGEPGPGDSPTDTGADGSTGDPTTSAGTAGTGDDGASTGQSGPDGVCGDGLVDAGEACDDGPANSDAAACTAACALNTCGDGKPLAGVEACDDGPANSYAAACTEACAVNVCGDGKLHAGVEACDDGPANSDFYGSACGTDCAPPARCGDGIIQADEGEECEPDPADDAQACDAACRVVAHRGFITSLAYTSDLGGLDGADAACRARAAAAGLPQPDKFRAFLGSADVSANQRFADKQGDDRPYLLPGGQQFAASYADLVAQGPAATGISITEFGAALIGVLVATNTTPDGEVHAPETSCASWLSTSKDFKAHVGLNALAPDDPDLPTWQSDDWWVGFYEPTCDTAIFHLYCLE